MVDIIHKKKSHIESVAAQQVSSYIAGSIQFATILVANLMIMNGGALLAFPAYLNGTKEGAPIRTDMIVSSATWFVVGIVLAAIAGYSAYLNFQFHARSRILESYKENIGVDEAHDAEPSQGLLNWRVTTKGDLDRRLGRSEMWINSTFWVGQSSGIGSLVSFVAGCYYARQAILP